MWLIINPGQPDERVVEIKDGATTIGRTEENTICILNNLNLSRQHARIERDGERVCLVDLQSKNGTFVNGMKVSRHALHPGDQFCCGEVLFQLLPESAVPSPAPPVLVRPLQTQLTALSMDELLERKESSATGHGSALLMRRSGGESAQAKLQILLKISELLSSPGSIDALLERIISLLFQILDVDRAALLLVEPDTGELRPQVVRTGSGEAPKGPVYSQHIVNYVRAHGVAALFGDARSDPRLGTADSVIELSICASMCVPLRSKEELLGVIYADNLSRPHGFTGEDLEFLTAFANQAAIALENSRLYQRIEEEAVLRNTYLRFFPPATIKKLQHSRSATLEVIETEVTALFADISDFTVLSSKLQPRQVVDLLNEYFPVMSEIVFRHEGTLEKYIGDALMAVWGAPFPHPDDVDRAMRAAVAMHQALEQLNADWRARGQAELQIHVGINTGRVAAGNIGSERYLQYATIGDATNVASRICGKAGAGELYISEETFVRWSERNRPWTNLGPRELKGKDEPVTLYRVDWRSPPGT